MFRKIAGVSLMVGALIVAGSSNAQEEKKKTTTVIGEVKGQKNTPDGKNTFIEVLAPGEEKAKSYHVMYDPKLKGPTPAILEKVRAAKVGERVEMECIQTNHGPAIMTFKVLKKAGDSKEKS